MHTSNSDTRGTRGSCVIGSSKLYDVVIVSDVFFGVNVLLFSSSRDFAGGADVTGVSDVRFLRFTVSMGDS